MMKIAVLGGGHIGEALIAGLASRDDIAINVSNRRPERGKELVEKYGVTDFLDSAEAVCGCSIVFVCVKPYGVVDMLSRIDDTLEDNAVVVSMAAGVSLTTLEEAVSAGTAIIRAMPNTPMFVRQGVTALSPGRHVSEEQYAMVVELLSTVGSVERVAEATMDAASSLLGASPAYIFLFAEAMIDAGVSLGFDRDTAARLAIGAMSGATAMLKDSGLDPVTLRAHVTSPAGSTAAGIRSLEEDGLRAAVYRALSASTQRSKELG